MASSTGDLLEQLLLDVAITGSRGLGADEINNTIRHHHRLSVAAQALPNGTGTDSGSARADENNQDFNGFLASLWQQLREHADLDVEESDELVNGPVDGADDQSASGGSTSFKLTPQCVRASEEHIWQAIAGHGVDHSRIPPKMWELLEVIAAAGPEGILQPEARRLTGQDKQSVPLRADQLANRGYITKERAAVPKMVTSRLRHWRYAENAVRSTDDEDWFDHGACFDALTSLLKNNNGIATTKDIQLGTDCTEKPRQKALTRCITRLEKTGLLRKVKARVEGEKLMKGTDRVARCLQLLREPTGLDREATKGRGGPVKLDAQGRTKTQIQLAEGKPSRKGKRKQNRKQIRRSSSKRDEDTEESDVMTEEESDEYEELTEESEEEEQDYGDEDEDEDVDDGGSGSDEEAVDFQQRTTRSAEHAIATDHDWHVEPAPEHPFSSHSATFGSDGADDMANDGSQSVQPVVEHPRTPGVTAPNVASSDTDAWVSQIPQSDTGQNIRLPTSRVSRPDDMDAETDAARPKNKRRTSSVKEAESNSAHQAHRPSARRTSRAGAATAPGVTFRDPSPRKRGRGRPRKTLIAVIKSDKLNEHPWFQEDVSSTQRPAASAPAASDLTPTPAASQTPVPATSSTRPTEDASAKTKTPSKASLGQIRRWQRLRADKMAAAAQTADQQPIPTRRTLVHEAAGGPPTMETTSAEQPASMPIVAEKGRAPFLRIERPYFKPLTSQQAVPTLQGQESQPGLQQPMAQQTSVQQTPIQQTPIRQTPTQQLTTIQPTIKQQRSEPSIERYQGFLRQARRESISQQEESEQPSGKQVNSKQLSAQSETAAPSKLVLGQRRRRERERLAKLAAQQEGPASAELAEPQADRFSGRVPSISHTPAGDGPSAATQASSSPFDALSTEEVPTVSSVAAYETPKFTSVIVEGGASSVTDMRDLPELRFVAFEEEDYANDPASWNPHKRIITGKHASHEERSNVVLGIVRKAGGVFPGTREMWFPFVTEWQSRHGGVSDVRTVSRTVETLRKEGRLKKYEFKWKRPSSPEKTYTMLAEPQFDTAPRELKKMQKRMIDALPLHYMPTEINVAAGLSKSQRPPSSLLSRKRAHDEDALSAGETPLALEMSADTHSDTRPPPSLSPRKRTQEQDTFSSDQNAKRQKTSAATASDSMMSDAAATDERRTTVEPHDWRNNFTPIEGATVKRTAAGINYSNAEAQRRGFADANARVHAKAHLGVPGYRLMQRAALNEGHLISADELPRKASETSKPRGGWPRGRPRKPITLGVGDDVVPLLSLLFYPRQSSLMHSGTIGTFSNTTSERKRAFAPNPMGAGLGQKASPKKRSADEMVIATQSSASSLLMAPGQVLLEANGTIGTNGTIGSEPSSEERGRGKRVKKSTEKATNFSRLQAVMSPDPIAALSPSPTPQPDRAAPTPYNPHLVDDPEHGTVSTRYKNDHPEETWYHRGHGRWSRTVYKPDTPRKPPSKSDHEEMFSTEYVNTHPNETFYHRGRGRWGRGLPPPGHTYKTAVKGPDAKAYLASIGTSEGKPKMHGSVVDGVQMKRSGEPWKKQPVTVNGVKVKPIENVPHPSPSSAQQTGTPSHGVAHVQYEAPQPLQSSAVPLNGDEATMPYFPPQPPPYGSLPTWTIDSMGNHQPVAPHLLVQPQTQLNLPSPAQSTSPPPPLATTKRKRPYTYKSRKQVSAVGPDGLHIEIDRDSDEDYTQTRSPKRQRKQSLVENSPAKKKHSINRERLSAAVALVKSLSAADTSKDLRWDLVGRAVQMNDKGAAAEMQFRSITNSAKHASFVQEIEQRMQELFLAAVRDDTLPHIDLAKLENVDWPGLLAWVERNVIPLVSEGNLMSSTDVTISGQGTAKEPEKRGRKPKEPGLKETAPKKKAKQTVDAVAMFPATYNVTPTDGGSVIDLNEDLITAKSWIRANSATDDAVYSTAKATEKLTTLGTPIVAALEEMQQTRSIRQLKKGRQRPGRNFEITQHVWEQFRRWPGDDNENGDSFLRGIFAAREEILRHLKENETLEVPASVSDQKRLALTSMVAQGLLKIDVHLPERNDDVDAPNPKLNIWGYCGSTHDTRKVARKDFDVTVFYSKSDAFTTQHRLRTGVPVPGMPETRANDALPRVPFWLDINGGLIPHIWEKVLSSVTFLLMRRPGVTAAGIEKAHGNKLWAWEIELVLEWMGKVGMAEKLGAGHGWTVADEWFCAMAPEVATW